MSKKGAGSQKSEVRSKAAPDVQRPNWAPWAPWATGAVIALIFLWAYSPVMRTGFLFDDTMQQFALPNAHSPLMGWMGPVRPVLMFTYWMNVQIAREPGKPVGADQNTFSYHLVNLLIHGAAALLVFFAIRRLMEWAGTDAGSSP